MYAVTVLNLLRRLIKKMKKSDKENRKNDNGKREDLPGSMMGLLWVIVTKAHHITPPRISQHVVDLTARELAVPGRRDTRVGCLEVRTDTKTPSAVRTCHVEHNRYMHLLIFFRKNFSVDTGESSVRSTFINALDKVYKIKA
jgi:hypothetical protein